jgi:signal transduction histidine kinase
LTLFHAVTLAVIVIGLSIALILLLGVNVQESVRETAHSRANEAARIIASDDALPQADLDRLSRDEYGIAAFDARGRIVVSAGKIGPLDETLGQRLWQSISQTPGTAGAELDSSDSGSNPFTDYFKDEAHSYYLYGVPVPPNSAGIAVVAVAMSYDTLGGNRWGNWTVGVAAAIFVAMILILGASYLNTRAILAPVRRFADSAQQMTGTDLTRRLPVGRGKRNELDQLARTFNGLLGRLQAAFQDREIALEEQKRFVQDAGHELRTPLTSILGYTRMLKSWGLNDPETANEAIAAIEKEAERMNGLVQRLLTLAHGDAESFLNLVECDLRDVVGDAAQSIAVAQGNKASIDVAVPGEPVPVLIERDLMTQAIVILLDNAVKYSPANGSVDVRLSTDGGEAVIAVRDTGIGISQSELPKVFDRFYRAETSRTKPGSGLGLAIAKQIAERHDGRIQVSSVIGEGSVFSITLPGAPHEEAHGTPVSSQVEV